VSKEKVLVEILRFYGKLQKIDAMERTLLKERRKSLGALVRALNEYFGGEDA